jgi:flagellar hook-associated protein 2
LAFEGGAVTGGSFRINGVEITVDPTTDSLSDILARINDSDAGVAASYDASNDTIRVASETLGSRTISFQSGTSNLLDRLNLVGATQTAGNDAQFRVNDGEILTRNTNEVADAVGGVTLNLLSAGTSTVTVERDVDAIVEDVQNFLGEINGAINNIVNRTRSGAVLAGDSSLRVIQNYVRNNMFLDVGGARGEFDNLLEIGISSGDNFSSEATMQYELDEEAFREALRSDSTSVASLFSNEDGDGIADRLEEYIDSVAGLDGFLNERARANGLIDQRIDGYNDQLDQMEERMQMRERRLRAQFTRMEQLASSYQQQSASLGGINTSLASLI